MPARSFSFIHAADLHLGAPLAGLTRQAADLARELERATYAALDNLVALARKTRPAAVLLAGDVCNSESGSAKAMLSLRDACAALGDLGITVCMVHGNHDPLTGRGLVSWPDNVHVFGGEAVTCAPIIQDNETLALVHGISHARREETGNLADLFRRAAQDIFQIGLLHCQVGAASGHLPYAPCNIDDLSRAGMDYWALGHVHRRGQVCARPPAWYPGNIQGLHINEDGPKGCLLVTVRDDQVAAVDFHALAPVEWLNLSVSLNGADTLDAAEERIRIALQTACSAGAVLQEAGAGGANTPGDSAPALTGYLARLHLAGRTSLDAKLRGAWGTDVLERLRAWGRELAPFVWIKDLRLDTAAEHDLKAMENRDDLLGETLRRLNAWQNDPEVLARLLDGPLDELYGPRAAQARAAGLLPPTADDLREQLAEAARLCVEYLSRPEKS